MILVVDILEDIMKILPDRYL